MTSINPEKKLLCNIALFGNSNFPFPIQCIGSYSGLSLVRLRPEESLVDNLDFPHGMVEAEESGLREMARQS